MIKVVALFKKKPELAGDEFRDYYENQHVKLFEPVVNQPGVEKYVRRYLTPIKDAISGETRSSGFDVIMEVWLSDPALFDKFYKDPLDPEFRQLVAEDEANLFDRDQISFHTVDEVETEVSNN